MRKLGFMGLFAAALIASASVFLCSCGSGAEDKEVDDELLVVVGDSSLYLRDVLLRIPGGLSEADSAAMFDAVVNSWVERVLLEDFGRRNIDDMDRIDRLTAEYRNRLIAESYRRQLRENRNSGVSDESIADYYKAHKDELLLESPVIKGIYLKIPSNAANLDNIRRWVFSGTSDGIDNLEKYGLTDALQYSFFEDRWMDWQRVARQIPYRFFEDDAFVESTDNFETEYQGVTYLLHISDFIRSGEAMPEEYATPVIAELLDSRSAADFESGILSSLYRSAVKEGRLKQYGYKKLNL